MNFTQLAGHLGADPEERRTPNGKKVWKLRVATRTWNEGKEETLWWEVSAWGDEFDNILKHLKKGSAVWVLGALRKPRIWNDREGKPQVSLEISARIVSFSPFGKSDRPGEGGYSEGSYPKAATPSYAGGMGETDFGMAPFGGASGGHRYEAPVGVGAQEEEMPF